MTEFQYGEIISYSKQGLSISEISKLTCIQKSTIGDRIRKYRDTEEICRKRGSGRSNALNNDDMYILKRIHKYNPKESAPKLNKIFNNQTSKTISIPTIKRKLNELGLFAYSPSKKPLLTKTHINMRMSYCQKYLYKSDAFWERVIFSDECKLKLYNSDAWSYLWRKPKNNNEITSINATVKYGNGGVFVWGCFSSKGMGNLVFIDEIMDKMVYLEILKNNLRQSAFKMGLDTFIFQHDRDPKHTAKVITKY